jgi:hypothetical protein
MGAWTKYYADGTKYVGSDEAVRLKKASWRNSRSVDIVQVDLVHSNKRISISGPGEYWQSDTFTVVYPDPSPTVIARRIQRKIVQGDFALQVSPGNNADNCMVAVLTHNDLTPCGLVMFQPEHFGKWLTVEYNVGSNPELNYYFSDRRL